MFAYCGNNPVSRQDDGGEFWNIVIGAGVGAVVSGLISVASQVLENKGIANVDWARVGVAAAAGAISGGFAATGIKVNGDGCKWNYRRIILWNRYLLKIEWYCIFFRICKKYCYWNWNWPCGWPYWR